MRNGGECFCNGGVPSFCKATVIGAALLVGALGVLSFGGMGLLVASRATRCCAT